MAKSSLLFHFLEMEPEEGLNSTQLTQAQCWGLFIPITEVPGNNPDPFEALATKEDMLLGGSVKNGKGIETNGHADPNNLERPESFDREKYNGSGNNETPLFLFADLNGFLAHEDMFVWIEQVLLRKRQPARKSRTRLWQSHGRRGRKPANKDKISPKVLY